MIEVGTIVGGRYQVLRELSPNVWQAKDAEGSTVFRIARVGDCDKKDERRIERVRRTISWLDHPNVALPKDFLSLPEVGLLAITPEPQGVALAERLASPLDLPQVVEWAISLCELLAQFHDARQPLILGQLPLENFVVDANGRLILRGLELTSELKFFLGESGKKSVSDDLRAVGQWLGQVCKANSDLAATVRRHRELQPLLDQLSMDNPERMPPSAAAVRARLEKMRWKAPVSTSSSVAALVQKAKDIFPTAFKLRQQAYLTGSFGLITFVLVVVSCLNLLFP